MVEVSYNIVIVDDNDHNKIFDIMDGEFGTLERAKDTLSLIIKYDREDNFENDWSTYKIQKVTRELI